MKRYMVTLEILIEATDEQQAKDKFWKYVDEDSTFLYIDVKEE